MLQNVYEYNPQKNKWIKFILIDRPSPSNNSNVQNDQHFRVMWYPIGGMGLLLAMKSNISKDALYSVCFPDPLVITPSYRDQTFFDVNIEQSFSQMSNDGDLYSYLNIPVEISTLGSFVIFRVSDNKLIIVGGHNVHGENSWLWQGELTNKRSLVKWTRKCKVGHLRYFHSANPFGFKLGDNMYFIGYDDRTNIELDYTMSESCQRQDNLYCDRYNLTEDKYHTNVYSVPSSLTLIVNRYNVPLIVLKDKHETFALIIAGLRQQLSFLFTVGKGFDDTRTVIYPKTVSNDYFWNLFQRLYHPIKAL